MNDRRYGVSAVPKFINPLEESDTKLESRLLNELKIDPSDEFPTAIPYEYIGANIQSLTDDPNVLSQYPELSRNYPDYYKLTPAYKLSFSGYTPGEQFRSFFDPKSRNSAGNRVKRWWNEDKTVNYAGTFAKISAMAGFLVLLITSLIALYQILYKAKVTYELEDDVEFYDENERDEYISKIKKLDNIANNPLIKYITLILSGIPTIIILINIYKRTTLPRHGVKIRSFNKGIIDRPEHNNESSGVTKVSPITKQNTMVSIGSPAVLQTDPNFTLAAELPPPAPRTSISRPLTPVMVNNFSI